MSGARELGSWITRLRAAYWLRGCDVGTDARLDGRPTIGTAGRVRIGRGFRLASKPVVSHMITGAGATLAIGEDVCIGHGAAIAVFSGLTIGDRTRIGPNVILMDTDFHTVGEREANFAGEPITIGCGVTIGSGVTILRGSTVHDGAVVAAGAVVSGDVPAGARVSGVPARIEADPRVTDGATLDDVPAVVMRALALPAPPKLSDGPGEHPQWDSLGALTILLALEDAFGVALDDRRVAAAGSIADLTKLVHEAQIGPLLVGAERA